jgi:two-component system response regulator CpxR
MAVRLLLVDDEQEFVDALADRLETRGFSVTKAFNAEEGLARLREKEVDVVLLDVLMPVKDGVETLRDIKQLNPLIEVIMLTGHATIESAIDGLKLGAYDYLMKPTDTEDLVTKILRAYARKSEQEERIRRAEIDKILASKGW